MEQQVTSLCNAVMNGVIASGVVNHGNIERTSEVLKAEVNAFLFGDKYASTREAVNGRSINDRYVVALIITNCIEQIRQ